MALIFEKVRLASGQPQSASRQPWYRSGGQYVIDVVSERDVIFDYDPLSLSKPFERPIINVANDTGGAVPPVDIQISGDPRVTFRIESLSGETETEFGRSIFNTRLATGGIRSIVLRVESVMTGDPLTPVGDGVATLTVDSTGDSIFMKINIHDVNELRGYYIEGVESGIIWAPTNALLTKLNSALPNLPQNPVPANIRVPYKSRFNYNRDGVSGGAERVTTESFTLDFSEHDAAHYMEMIAPVNTDFVFELRIEGSFTPLLIAFDGQINNFPDEPDNRFKPAGEILMFTPIGGEPMERTALPMGVMNVNAIAEGKLSGAVDIQLISAFQGLFINPPYEMRPDILAGIRTVLDLQVSGGIAGSFLAETAPRTEYAQLDSLHTFFASQNNDDLSFSMTYGTIQVELTNNDDYAIPIVQLDNESTLQSISKFGEFSGSGLYKRNVPPIPVAQIPFNVTPVRIFPEYEANVFLHHSFDAPFTEINDEYFTFACLDGPDRTLAVIVYALNYIIGISGSTPLQSINRIFAVGDGFSDETSTMVPTEDTLNGFEVTTPDNWQETREVAFDPPRRFYNPDSTKRGQTENIAQPRPEDVADDVLLNLGVKHIAKRYTGTRIEKFRGQNDMAPIRLVSVHVDSFYVVLSAVEPQVFELLGSKRLRFDLTLSRNPVFGPMETDLLNSEVYDPLIEFFGGTLNEDSKTIRMITPNLTWTRQSDGIPETLNANVLLSAGHKRTIEEALYEAGYRTPEGSTEPLVVPLTLPIRFGLRGAAARTSGSLFADVPIDLEGGEPRRANLDLVRIPFYLEMRAYGLIVNENGEYVPDPDPEEPVEQPQIPSSLVAAPTQLEVFQGNAAYKGSPGGDVGPRRGFKIAAQNYTGRPDVAWQALMTRINDDLQAYPPNATAYAIPNLKTIDDVYPDMNLTFARQWYDHDHDALAKNAFGTTRETPANGVFYWPRPRATACGVRFPPVVDPHTFFGHHTRPVFTLLRGSNAGNRQYPVAGIQEVLGIDRPEGRATVAVLQRGAKIKEADPAPAHAVIALAPKPVTLCLEGWTATCRTLYRQTVDYEALGGSVWAAGPFETNTPADALPAVELALAPAVSPSNPEEGAHPWWGGLAYNSVATAMHEASDGNAYHIYYRTRSSAVTGHTRHASGGAVRATGWTGSQSELMNLGSIGEWNYFYQPVTITLAPGDQLTQTTSENSALAAAPLASPARSRPGAVLAIMAGGTDMTGARIVARDEIKAEPNPSNTLLTTTISWTPEAGTDLHEIRPVLFAPWCPPIGTRFVFVEFGIRLSRT